MTSAPQPALTPPSAPAPAPSWESGAVGVRLRFSTEPWSLISALIRLRTDCALSHVEFERADGWTFGARFSLLGKLSRLLRRLLPFSIRHRFPSLIALELRDGVHHRPPSANARQRGIVHATFPGIESAYLWGVVNRLNRPYDFLAILGIITARNWFSRDSDFCSDLVDECAEFGATPPFTFIRNSAWATTPRDLFTTSNMGFRVLDGDPQP